MGVYHSEQVGVISWESILAWQLVMRGKSVIIVERDAEEAKQIVAFLRSAGFRNTIKVLSSKSDALDYIFRTGEYADLSSRDTPGLILLDLETNRTKEVKRLESLQSYLRTAAIPIIILTNDDQQEEAIGSYHLGAIAICRKPLDLGHLVDIIVHLYEQKQ